jgi:hypothetical protein
VKIKGVCTESGETLEVEEVKDCEIKIDYKSTGACYVKYVPLDKYMSKLAPFTGAFLIVFGLIMCFYGSKALPIMIATLVCVMVTGATCMVGFNFLTPEKATMVSLVILLVVGLIIGGLAGYFAFRIAAEWGMTLLGFAAGIMLALMILKLTQVQNQNASLGAAVVGGAIGGIIGYKFSKKMLIFGTAFIGAFFIIRGTAIYLGNFPSEFASKGEELTGGEMKFSGEILYYTIGYFVGLIFFFIVGAIVQHRIAEKQAKDADEGAFDGEEEGRCCGVF